MDQVTKFEDIPDYSNSLLESFYTDGIDKELKTNPRVSNKKSSLIGSNNSSEFR